MKSILSYLLHKVWNIDKPTDQHTNQPTYMCKAICPSFFQVGIIIMLLGPNPDRSDPKIFDL